MRAARVVITAQSAAWARTAAQSLTGFATSVIGCKVEAGIEAELPAESTPDLRPGISVLLFGFDAEGLQRQLIDRVGQTVLTCPTTACFDGLPDAPERVVVGGQLRHFGDKFQSSKMMDGQRYWRIPVMEGEFLVQESFGIQKAIGGGNLLILGEHQAAALAAAEAAVTAMRVPRRDSAVSRRHRARRQQGRREEIQEHDRVHQRRVLSDAAWADRRGDSVAGAA